MHLNYRNINDGFRGLVGLFADTDEGPKRGDIVHRRDSRQGKVLYINEPMTITYSHPRERVLFNSARDVNPFFLLYEQLWMLAGRNDVASLAYYNSKIAEIASDDGVTFNGAYGYRWRHDRQDLTWAFNGNDQLDLLVNHLKADPNSRRAVLQMWNVEDDLLKIGSSKDVCCNLSVVFSIRQTITPGGMSVGDGRPPFDSVTYYEPQVIRHLDITVTNRSNDLVWGLLGSDYVTFTILQEYMAARLGCEVGVYHHFTSNLHVYDWNWKPTEWLADETASYFNETYDTNGYSSKLCHYFPLVKDPAVFERELHEVVDCCWGAGERGERETFRPILEEPFLQNVAVPMFGAFAQHKLKNYEGAMSLASSIDADDWRIAATNWLTKRSKK